MDINLNGAPADENIYDTCQDCVTAGYVTTYSAGADHNFSFVTIKGAGHMVPEFKPVQALQFLTRFFTGKPF